MTRRGGARAGAAIAAALAIAAGCGPRYLGARVPASCGAGGDFGRCVGWAYQRTAEVAGLAVHDDPALRAYLEEVAARLGRVAGTSWSPVVIVTSTRVVTASAGQDDRIYVSRQTLAMLGSEAELAALLAHELVHVLARHGDDFVDLPVRDDADEQARRDDESLADERAVALLRAAGYAPQAMARLLEAIGDPDHDALDREHPPHAERLARIALVAGDGGGRWERERYLARIDGLPVGDDPRLGAWDGDTWSAAAVGIRVRLPDGWDSYHEPRHVSGWRDGLAMGGGVVGAAWADAIAGRLVARRSIRVAGRDAVRGVMPLAGEAAPPAPGTFAEVAADVIDAGWRPGPASEVAVIPGGDVAVVIAVDGDARAAAALDELLAGAARMSRAERRAVAPSRLRIARAAAAGRLDEAIAAACADPGATLDARLDDPAREVAAGDPLRCVERPRR